MIIIKIQGGLGNQMFNYAFARKIALTLNTQLKLDLYYYTQYHRPYQLNLFNINESIANPEEISRIRDGNHLSFFKTLYFKIRRRFSPYYKNPFTMDKNFLYDENLLKSIDNTYFSGTWQSELYFKDIREILLEEFHFKHNPSAENISLIQEIQNKNSIAIHVRRGDYITFKNDADTIGVLPITYYNSAIEYISSRIQNPCFYIFTDDIEWVEQNLKTTLPQQIITHNNINKEDYEDMRLMIYCKHHIIANSTFSWWGAWLSMNEQGIKIAPKKWFKTSKIETKDIVPQNWIKL